MYSYEDRMRAVKLYIQYGKSPAATVQRLGYPSKKNLLRWYRSYAESGDLPKGRRKAERYSAEQKRTAVEHYRTHGGCLARTIRMLGYPSAETLRAWIDELLPGSRQRSTGKANRVASSPGHKKAAVIKLGSRDVPASTIAEAFGVSRPMLYKWREQLLAGETMPRMKRRKSPPSGDEQKALVAEVESLQKRVRQLELEHDILVKANELLKKDQGVDPQILSNREKALLIDALRRFYPLSELLAALRLPRSSYYYQRACERRPDKYAEARCTVTAIFDGNHRCYGYRRIGESLRRHGTPMSEKVVRRLMAEEGLVVHSTRRRRYNAYRGELSPAVGNVINRDFRAAGPNEKWLTDLTEFSLPAGKVYLSPVIDCFDGLVVSWAVGTRPDADLVNAMLEEAIGTLDPDEKPTVHSDRGAHYRWPGWISRIEGAGLTRSMSRKGCTPDNAACEGFFGRLKTEWFYAHDWRETTIEQFIVELYAYIRWYNEKRIKVSLGALSPVEYRESLGIAA